MGNTVSRIKQYIDYKGMSVRQFEESVGFSNGAFASQYKNNKTIGVDKVENILQIYTDINPVWLLTGKGDMCISTDGANVSCVTTIEKQLLAMLKEKDAKIEEQAKIIGRLEERLLGCNSSLKKNPVTSVAGGVGCADVEK